MSLSVWAVDALACFRLTRLVVEDEITADLREVVWKRFDPEKTKIGYAVTCPHCSSVWLAAGIGALRSFAPRTANALLPALAVAGAVSLINDARAWADVVH